MRVFLAILFSLPILAADIAPFVPRPTWGIDETPPARPSPWTSDSAGYYYINEATGTDVGRTYGNPTAPRATIPDPLPDGSYIEVAGVYSDGSDATYIEANGTSGAWTANTSGPVWITSAPGDRAIFTLGIFIQDSEYLYFDGITVTNHSWEVGQSGNQHHIMLRNSVLVGDGISDISGVIVRGTAGSLNHNNIIVSSNIVTKFGDMSSVIDQDCIGITLSRNVSYGWALSNLVSLTSGPGIRLGSSSIGVAAASADAHHLYAHANNCWSNLQVNYWIKFGSNVVFSQNIAHHALPHPVSPGTLGMSFGGQYAPYNVIWINNFAYSNSMGFQFESFGELTADYTNHVVGNVFYKIGLEHDATWDVNASGQPAAMMFNATEGSKTYVWNNTIYDCISGIHQSADGGDYYYYNNIVAELSRTDSWHLRNSGDEANVLVAETNLFYDSVTSPRIAWVGNTYTVAQWISNTSTGDGTITTDPLLDDPSNNDFGIGTSSPAKDAGHDPTLLFGHDIIARLNAIHGTSTTIADIIGTSRPQNSLWDIGAMEYTSGAPPQVPGLTISGGVISGATLQ